MKRTYLAYGLGLGFLILTTNHLQHTFSKFDDQALSWVLAVALEFGVAVASFYSFDSLLDKWARVVAGCWLGGLLLASYSLNVTFYLAKADYWSFALGLIFPASIATLGALEPALRKADRKAQSAAQGESVNPTLSTSTPSTRAISVKRQQAAVKRQMTSVKVIRPEVAQLSTSDRQEVQPDHQLAVPARDRQVDTSECESVNLDTAQSVNLTGQEVSPDDWKAQARLLSGTGMSKAEIARTIGKSRQIVSGYLNSLTVDGDNQCDESEVA